MRRGHAFVIAERMLSAKRVTAATRPARSVARRNGVVLLQAHRQTALAIVQERDTRPSLLALAVAERRPTLDPRFTRAQTGRARAHSGFAEVAPTEHWIGPNARKNAASRATLLSQK